MRHQFINKYQIGGQKHFVTSSVYPCTPFKLTNGCNKSSCLSSQLCCLNFIETCKIIPCGVTNIRWEFTVETFLYKKDRLYNLFRWEPDTTGMRKILIITWDNNFKGNFNHLRGRRIRFYFRPFHSRFQVTFQSPVALLVLNIPNYITKFGILHGNLLSQICKLLN